MSTGNLCPVLILQFFGNDGTFLVGGQLATTIGGTPTAVYSDQALSIPLPNPIILNSRGEVATSAGDSSQIYLEPNTAYVFTLSDADGNQIWQASNIVGISNTNVLAAGTDISLTTVGNTTTIASTVDLTPYAELAGAAFTGNVSVSGTISSTGVANFNT